MLLTASEMTEENKETSEGAMFTADDTRGGMTEFSPWPLSSHTAFHYGPEIKLKAFLSVSETISLQT